MMRRLLPHPYLSLTLFIVWFFLINDLKIGSAVLSGVLAIIIPLLTSAYWPDRPVVKSVTGLIAYGLLIFWDVILANVQVAWIILFMPQDRIKSAWIPVPIDLHTPEAIALLSGTITMTPGTLTADMSDCGRVLLIHALHAPDPDAVRDQIKARYETRLKRIFE